MDDLIQSIQKQFKANIFVSEAPKEIHTPSKAKDTSTCEECGFNASYGQSLRLHTNTEHLKQKHNIFICKLCST